MTQTYTLTVSKTSDHYEVAIPGIDAKATGASFDEAVVNAELTIARAQIAAQEQKKRVRTRKKQKQSAS